MRPLLYEAPGDAPAAVRAVSADPDAMFLAGGNVFKIELLRRTLVATLRELS